MNKKVLKFHDIEIEKCEFYQHKKPISIDNSINRIIVSNEASFVKKEYKYFIGYKNVKAIRPLSIFLPKMSIYRRDFNKTKCMSFLIKDENTLEKYDEISEKVSNITSKKIYSEPVHNIKYLKTKIKPFKEKINTKESSQCIYISAILIDSVYRKDKNYYPQVFLVKYGYVVKEDSDEENSDDSDKENSFLEKIKKLLFFGLCKFPPEI